MQAHLLLRCAFADQIDSAGKQRDSPRCKLAQTIAETDSGLSQLKRPLFPSLNGNPLLEERQKASSGSQLVPADPQVSSSFNSPDDS